MRAVNQTVAVAAMCLQEEAGVRPLISDVVTALSFLGNGENAATKVSPDAASLINTPPAQEVASDANGNNEDRLLERQKEVAEAIQWGSNSRQAASWCATASSP